MQMHRKQRVLGPVQQIPIAISFLQLLYPNQQFFWWPPVVQNWHLCRPSGIGRRLALGKNSWSLIAMHPPVLRLWNCCERDWVALGGCFWQNMHFVIQSARLAADFTLSCIRATCDKNKSRRKSWRAWRAQTFSWPLCTSIHCQLPNYRWL